MGVVIGETAEIGNRCLLYQGVTLGAQEGTRKPNPRRKCRGRGRRKSTGCDHDRHQHTNRHGSVVVRDVESNCTVVGIPGRVIHQSGVRINPLAHSALPDAEANVIRNLMERIDQLEGQVHRLQNHLETMTTASSRPLKELQSGQSQSLKDREIVEFLGD